MQPQLLRVKTSQWGYHQVCNTEAGPSWPAPSPGGADRAAVGGTRQSGYNKLPPLHRMPANLPSCLHIWDFSKSSLELDFNQLSTIPPTHTHTKEKWAWYDQGSRTVILRCPMTTSPKGESVAKHQHELL